MSDVSDYEFLEVDDDFSYNRNNRNDDPLDSSDDEDPTVLGMRVIKRAKSLLEKDRRDHQSKLYTYLQEVILNGQPRKQTWKRMHTVARAEKICQDLRAEEGKLLVELEFCMQENWKLKNRIRYLKRKKKGTTKSSKATLTRRVSNLSLTPPKLILPEKRRVSMDDTKIVDLTSTVPSPTKKDIKSDFLNVNIPKPKRRLKKRSGLSEEEKEYVVLHEKIDDLLYEVDCIWDDVKDDEEFKEDEIFNIDDYKLDLPNKHKMPKLIPMKTRGSKTPKKKTQKAQVGQKFISLTDINKLMNPQFVQSSEESSSKNLSNSINVRVTPNKRDSSDDEDRLVIVDEEPPKSVHEEMDLIEALRAVDNLCRTIIPDVDEPPPQEFPVQNALKKRPVRNTRNSKQASDIIVIEE